MESNQAESLHAVFMQVRRMHRHKMHALLQGQEVYPGQPPLLFALSREDGQSQKELSEKLQNKPATITVMINRMEKTGLIERRPDARDQRISRVYLTDKGRQVRDEVGKALKILEAECFANFADDEKEQLRTLLLKMQGNLKDSLDRDSTC